MQNAKIYEVHERFCQHVLAIFNGTNYTVNWHKDAINQYIKFTKIKKISEITKRNIEDFLVNQSLRGLSAKTRKNRLQSLCCFVDWLIEQGYLPSQPKDPYNGNFVKRIPKPRLPHKEAEFLDEEQIRKLLYWARNFPYFYHFEKSRAVVFFGTMLLTGIRLNEFLMLDRRDVDLERRSIHIRHGKGLKERTIPIPQQLVPVIEHYLAERDDLGRRTEGFLSSLTRDGRMSQIAVRRLVSKIRKKSGIRFSPHTLRHTYATIMMRNRGRLDILSKLLGHASIAITSSVYVHVTDEDKRHQVEKFPPIL